MWWGDTAMGSALGAEQRHCCDLRRAIGQQMRPGDAKLRAPSGNDDGMLSRGGGKDPSMVDLVLAGRICLQREISAPPARRDFMAVGSPFAVVDRWGTSRPCHDLVTITINVHGCSIVSQAVGVTFSQGDAARGAFG